LTVAPFWKFVPLTVTVTGALIVTTAIIPVGDIEVIEGGGSGEGGGGF
jgi:hypothetical protein